MAMKHAPESDGFTHLGNNQYFNNAPQLIQMWEEMAERGVQSEEELNNLKLSNLTRLGALRKAQEQQVLDAAIKANKRLIKDKMRESFKALKEEENLERTRFAARLDEQLKLEEAKRKKKKQAPMTAAEKKAFEERLKIELETEFKQRRKHLIEQSKWEQKNKEKELKQEAAQIKRQKQKSPPP